MEALSSRLQSSLPPSLKSATDPPPRYERVLNSGEDVDEEDDALFYNEAPPSKVDKAKTFFGALLAITIILAVFLVMMAAFYSPKFLHLLSPCRQKAI